MRIAHLINFSNIVPIMLALCLMLLVTYYALNYAGIIGQCLMKNKDDFRFKGKPSRACTKSTPFPVSKDERDTKEDTGKSMRMHCTCCGMPKGTCRAESMSNSEKIKPVALAVIELHLSEGISQLLTYLLTYSVSRKFCRIKKI